MLKRTDQLIRRGLASLQEFLRIEASAGVSLMAAALLALFVANTVLSGAYGAFLDLPVEVRIGALRVAKPLVLWINDGLMAVFFLLVGLELKRELLEGHLSDPREIILPALGAIGGMAAPAAIYVFLNAGDEAALKGWAIPAATDIAFALGVLMLLGSRVPSALKVFLLSVAIFDDLGAIVIIAAFYTADLSVTALVAAGVFIVMLAALNRLGVSRLGPYFVVGIPLWVALLKSGVHATLAGVVIALFIPLRAPAEPGDPKPVISPLHQLEAMLHPWVAYAVLPLFAFANAGLPLAGLSLEDLGHPVTLGVIAGLFLGKQLGIMTMCWLGVRLGIAALPPGIRWLHLHGASLLCGIGFTMSLFIASLAFEQGGGAYLGLERLGILVGSLVSGIAGYLLLRVALPAARD